MNYSVATLFLIKKDKACFKRLFRSLNKSEDDQSEISFAKNISSVITHILIELEGSETKDEIKAKIEGYRLYDWLDIQVSILNGAMTVKGALNKIQQMLEESNG